MRRLYAGIVLLFAVALILSLTIPFSGSTGSPENDRTMYTCLVMPHGHKKWMPLFAEGKPGARIVGWLPVSPTVLGCVRANDEFLHILAPRSYLVEKTGAHSGFGREEDVQLVTNGGALQRYYKPL